MKEKQMGKGKAPSRVIRPSFFSKSVALLPVSSKGVIESEDVERKVAKIERYSSFRVSRLWALETIRSLLTTSSRMIWL
jgi:hypothetical protein